MTQPLQSRRLRTVAVAVAATAACAAATSALGCSAATIGLGSLGLGVGALVTYLLLAAGGGTACSPRGPVGACLSIAPHEGPCLSQQPVEPCLSTLVPQPDAGVEPPPPGPCLEYVPVEPCLEYVPVEPYPHDCLSIEPEPCLSQPIRPCLSMPAPADAGAAPTEDAPPPYLHICLSDDLIEGELTPPGARLAPPPQSSAAPAQRLAAAGLLTEDQLRRLARLRGER